MRLEASKVLDFDTENVPGFYWYDGKASDRLHTVCWSWMDEDYVAESTTVWVEKSGLELDSNLEAFWAAVEKADAVTAHNIKRHDVKLLDAYRFRNGLPPLRWPHIIDTMDMAPKGGGMSRSQENLATMEALIQEKPHLPLVVWEEAARGDPDACREVVERCVADVRQHKALYKALSGR